VLRGLGDLESKLSRNREARDAYDEASVLFKAVDDRLGEADVLRGLGDLESKLGRNIEARDAYDMASSLFKAVDDRLGEADVLRGLGDLESKLGRNKEARDAYDKASQLYKAVGDRVGEANALRGLGDLEYKLGKIDEARRRYRDAAIEYGRAGMEIEKEKAERLASEAQESAVATSPAKPGFFERIRAPFNEWPRNDKLVVIFGVSTVGLAILALLVTLYPNRTRAMIGHDDKEVSTIVPDKPSLPQPPLKK
jgi:tetratricopeptide (TPR) repeat protein